MGRGKTRGEIMVSEAWVGLRERMGGGVREFSMVAVS